MRLHKQQLRPIVYDGLERIGTNADGGYVVDARLIDSAVGILSLGLGYEWTFDVAVRERNKSATIIGVDPTIHPAWFAKMRVKSRLKIIYYQLLGRAANLKRYQRWNTISRLYFKLFRGPIQHVRKMVSAVDGPHDISFSTLISMIGDVPRHRVVVKMDIEGSEYDVIPAICAHADAVSMLTVEFHDLASKPERFNEGVARLLEKFCLVHIHGNNHAPYSIEENFPDVVEITFINKDLCPHPTQMCTRSYPVAGLDYPNHAEKEDYVLVFDDQES